MGEIAKHLRTIHFAIIAICILILIPKIGLRPNRVETAFKQLQSIKEIQKTWPLWTKRFALEQLTWIKNSAIYRFKGEPEHGYIASAELDAANIRHSPNQGLQLRLNGAPIYFYLNVRGSTRPLILAKPQGKLDVADTFPSEISFPGDDSGSKAFVTLQDFTHFWEAALQPRASYLVGISPISYLVRGNTVVAELQTTQDIRPGGGMTLTSRQLGGCEDNEGINSISRRVSKDGYNELFCGSLDDGFLVFPVKKREPRVESNLQKWLIQQFNIGTFSGSKFSEAFPELDRITKGYQELAIDKVAPILEGELERAGERIQVLGLQLPEQFIATWGMLILITVQIYFLVQLWSFLRMSQRNFDEQARNAGWIGLYRESLARLLSFLTIGLLPLLQPC